MGNRKADWTNDNNSRSWIETTKDQWNKYTDFDPGSGKHEHKGYQIDRGRSFWKGENYKNPLL